MNVWHRDMSPIMKFTFELDSTSDASKERSYHVVFPVRTDGSVESISSHKAPPLYFYSRGIKSSFISKYDIQDFNEDSLKDRIDDVILLSFDGKDENYYLSFDYFYTLDEQ